MSLCNCEFIRLSRTINIDDKIKHFDCGRFMKCEVNGCDEVATERYVSYIVCSNHIPEAEKTYVHAKPFTGVKEKSEEI